MNYSRIIIFSFILITFLTISCKEKTELDKITGEVELFLIDEFEVLEGHCQIVESSVVLYESPLVTYDDFLSYNTATHEFDITENAASTIENIALSTSTINTPFAIVADNEIIYTAYFWPAISSAMCDWLVADPLFINNRTLLPISLGYPSEMDEFNIPDKRNDKRITEIFKRDNKLIE